MIDGVAVFRKASYFFVATILFMITPLLAVIYLVALLNQRQKQRSAHEQQVEFFRELDERERLEIKEADALMVRQHEMIMGYLR